MKNRLTFEEFKKRGKSNPIRDRKHHESQKEQYIKIGKF